MARRTIGSHMKKVLLTILSLIYLAVSVEAAGYLHDCVSTLGTCSTEQATGEEPFLPCSSDAKACEFQIKRKVGETSIKSPRSSYSHIFLNSQGFPGSIRTSYLKLLTRHSPASGILALFILYRVFRI